MKIIITLILFILSGAVSAERPSNEQPMYGGTHNPTVEKNEEHSASAASLGWQYFNNGDLNTAIKRFNQSWMFDRENAEAYWGFGLIMGRRSTEGNTETNLQESIKYLAKANQLSKNDYRIIVDLAFSKTLLGYFLKENKKATYKNFFREADALFKKAQNIKSNYPPLYYNWSVLKFYEEDYSLAESKLKKAKKQDYKARPNYEKELSDKLKNS
ncbi:MAG: hypothetical protein JKX87_08040 [Cycloclasticus sp.]|nr:hypothetical protein [Cycloclasticus sp.]